MGFKLVPNPTFRTTVSLSVPGQKEPGQIEVEFFYNHSKELSQLIELWNPANTRWGKIRRRLRLLWRSVTRRHFPEILDALAKQIASWDGVSDARNEPLPFTRERLSILFANYPAAPDEILYAYFVSRAEANSKN